MTAATDGAPADASGRPEPDVDRPHRAGAAGATTAGAKAAVPSPEGLVVRDERPLTERLTEVVVASPVLARDVALRVLVPGGFDPARDHLPVLWLLHGGDDDHRSWSDKGAAEACTAGLPLIVVMPDCSPFGWYTDWVRPTARGPQQWETHHLHELRPWVEARYRTRTDREARAVVGLSMGGLGALGYAARHPELFGFAAAFSGALDIRDPAIQATVQWSTGAMGGSPGDVWGDPVADADAWRAHNPTDLVEQLRSVEVQVRTGDGAPGGRHGGGPDPIEVAVHRASVRFHRALDDAGIGHVFTVEAGVHDWPYWQDHLAATLPRVVARAAAGRSPSRPGAPPTDLDPDPKPDPGPHLDPDFDPMPAPGPDLDLDQKPDAGLGPDPVPVPAPDPDPDPMPAPGLGAGAEHRRDRPHAPDVNPRTGRPAPHERNPR